MTAQARDEHRYAATVVAVSIPEDADEVAFLELHRQQDVCRHSAAKIKCPNVIDGVAQNAMMKPVYIGCLAM